MIHQKNGGLSAARNAGLDVARGAWIGFVDSDDYIAPEMYEKLYCAVQQTGADLALCDYAKVDEAGAPCVQTHVAVPQKSLTGRELLQKAYWTTVQIAWNKLYRRTIFAQLRYPVGKLNEDFFVIPEICLNTQKAVVVPDVLYYYVQRGDSIMGKSRTLRHYDGAQAGYCYWNCLVENKMFETLPEAAKYIFNQVSKIYWTLPAALRKEPRSMEMLRMQAETVCRTRQYCAVPLKLQLQSWLLWRCPQVYGWLRDMSK